MPLVAGVDSSTQSTKVEVRDADTGAVVTHASAPHPPTTPPRSEQDPLAWWNAFETAWAAAGPPVVDAISIAGQQHGMVVLDAAGEVVRPAKLWNDTESAPDSGWLLKQLPGGAEQWAAACGSVPVAAFTITKLSWLHRGEPEHHGRDVEDQRLHTDPHVQRRPQPERERAEHCLERRQEAGPDPPDHDAVRRWLGQMNTAPRPEHRLAPPPTSRRLPAQGSDLRPA